MPSTDILVKLGGTKSFKKTWIIRLRQVASELQKPILLSCSRVSGGGVTSGRAITFCMGRPGYNPGMDLGFFQFRIAVNLFSLGVGLFLIKCNRTVHTLPSSFLFSIIIYQFKIDHLQSNNVPRKMKN